MSLVNLEMKDLIKYVFFLITVGGIVVSVTLFIASRPDRSEVQNIVDQKLIPVSYQLQKIEEALKNISLDIKDINKQKR